MLVLSLVIVKAKFTRFARKTDLSTLTKILKLAAPFALARMVGTFTNTIGVILLMLLLDPEATGQFNAALTLQFALLSFVVMYQTVFLPTMSRLHKDKPGMLSSVLHRTQRLFFIVGLPTALGGWLYAEEIMTFFYGQAFIDSARSFEIIIFNIAIATAVLGNSTALAATRHQNLNLLIGVSRTITTIGLSFALIPLWGHVGAAFAFLIPAILKAGLSTFAVRRLVARTDLLSTLSGPIFAGVAMILILYALPSFPLWLGVISGGSLYFLLLFLARGITKEDWALVKDALRGALFR